MKSNIKNILIAFTALSIGVTAGYFIFGHENISSEPNQVLSQNGLDGRNNSEIWTCSMHPQIRQNEPGDCPICGMDLIPLTENSSNNPFIMEMTNEAVKLADIQTSLVSGPNVNTSGAMRISGKVYPDERMASSQVAHVPGRIEKLYVSFTGEQVVRGQRVADVYSPELITAQRELLEAKKLINLNPNLIDAVKNKLRFWKISEEFINKILEDGKIKETFGVFADASGIVTNRRVSVGDYLRQGEPLFDLMDLRKVWILFDAYEEDLTGISLGDKVEFTTPSVPNKVFKADVTFIDPVINPSSRTASVRIEFNNAGKVLKPEMLVYGMLYRKPIASKHIIIPKSSVMWTGKRSVVYVKVPNVEVPSFEFREVELGESLGKNIQVLNGLTVGEEVVTNGSFTLDAAAQLNNQSSMMNRKVSIKEASSKTISPDFTKETPAEFKAQLNAVVQKYLAVKDALTATNNQAAKTAAEKFVASLPTVDMAILQGEGHAYWMKQLNALNNHGQHIVNAKSIIEQRQQFDFLSQAMIKVVKSFGIGQETLYVQHCPMAAENQGADWLSQEKEIKNPYFGEKMMKCGKITMTIGGNPSHPEKQ